jgi:hypothetical protein
MFGAAPYGEQGAENGILLSLVQPWPRFHGLRGLFPIDMRSLIQIKVRGKASASNEQAWLVQRRYSVSRSSTFMA